MDGRHDLAELRRYESGASEIPGVEHAIKLSSNENPFGPGLQARTAFRRSSQQLGTYPPQDQGDLRNAIGRSLGLDPTRVICGAGSDEVLGLLCQAFAGSGDEVLHTRHGFGMYRVLALAHGATPIEVEEPDRRVDVGMISKACNARTRIVFVTNPGNPTGTVLRRRDLEHLADEIPEGALLVLDGAYAEYAVDHDGGASLASSCDNVVMTRTFSKIHGLAGLRIGYGYGPARVIDVLERIRGPFNVSAPALAAAAAAIGDREHVRRSLIHNTKWREWLRKRLQASGVFCDESSTNFLLARFESPSMARSCDQHLKSAGIIVRRMDSYKLPECLRITIGSAIACHEVADSVQDFMSRSDARS